jgi:hypothetical protein
MVGGFRLGAVLLMLVLVTGCGGSRDHVPIYEKSVLVVVNYDLFVEIEESIANYARGLESLGVDVHVERWVPGTIHELRSLVFEYVDEEGIEGALLVGSLPIAWYEQEAFEEHEEFPTDIVLQDRDAVWTDTDRDGVFDTHTPLRLDLYTSRIDGTSEQLKEFFHRVDYYRHVGPLVDVGAIVFVDEPWSHRAEMQSAYLDNIYEQMLIMHEPSDTTLDSYISVLSTPKGAEYVYQGCHSEPHRLQISGGEGGGFSSCYCYEMCEWTLYASFFNLFNCSAARIYDPKYPQNLASTYLLETGYGLAVVGSTKTGAIWDSRLFQRRLAEGRTWGGAYLDWYNEVGVRSDAWHLGILLMGDPLLHLHGNSLPRLLALSTPWSDPPEDSEIMIEIAKTTELGTFEEYREAHPEFFQE